MSQLQSTLLSEKPLIEGNSVTLPIVKVGTKAYSSTGKAFTLTKCALESGAESWKGGIITVNHQVREKGFISKAWFEDPFVYAKLDELSAEAVESVNSAAFRGVSQECEPLEIKSTNVTKLNGSGLTLVFYPHKPACSREMGCGVVASTEVAANDEERHVFDVAVLNNAGKQIKVKEISVWLYDDETDSPDRIKEEITRIVGYDGLGTFFVYDRDDSLSIGDEIPEDLEPVHTVMITVSNSPILTLV